MNKTLVMMRTIAPCLAIVCFTLTGCGEPNVLDGSMGDLVDLEFDRVQLRRQADTLLIEYVREFDATNLDKVVKITLGLADLPFEDGTYIDDYTFLERVTVTRVHSDGEVFPTTVGGRLYFESFNMDDSGVLAGEFDAVFDNGHTLFGDFEGLVEVVTD